MRDRSGDGQREDPQDRQPGSAQEYERIIITGCGILGACVKEVFPGAISVDRSSKTRNHRNVDMTDPAAMSALLGELRPEVIIHTAAMTNVDACEQRQDEARRANVEATAWLCRWAVKHHARLVFISTDYVFDGEQGAYKETDDVRPLSVYAKTKVEAEASVRALLPESQYLIFRVSATISPYGRDWMLEALREGKPIQATDEIVTPTYAPDAAESIRIALQNQLSGTYHLATSSSLTRYALARKLAAAFNYPTNSISEVSGEIFWAGKAQRPKNSSLDTTKALKQGLIIRSTDEVLADYTARVQGR